MSTDEATRRKFLLQSVTGASAAWVAANWSSVAAAAEAKPWDMGGRYAYFTPAQAAEIDAISAQIIPTTDTPGAREARVLFFIDLALVSFAQDEKPVYEKGFQALAAKVQELHPGIASFAALNSDQQIALLKTIEKTPFFTTVRKHTVMGMFAAPQHSGNYNKVGWNLIGFDDALNFEAPFGYYDV